MQRSSCISGGERERDSELEREGGREKERKTERDEIQKERER